MRPIIFRIFSRILPEIRETQHLLWLALLLAFAAQAAGGDDAAPGIVYAQGAKFDKSFNEAAYTGAEKLVCAREMGRRPLCLIVGQPTRGVDIAASDFIHRRLLALREAGTAILLVSADLDEIRALADRILVMEGGRIAGTLGPTASERELGLLMGGGLPR